MLGDKQVFGSRLAYFIKSRETILGCLQFSASSWALSTRDEWIGWKVQDRKQRLQLIVNNSRFLILPWVSVKNLASKVLSLAIKQLQEDWLREYCYAPVLLETFVDTSHFAGTCYKASNWTYLGETQGRGRMDRKKEYALSRKAIYMYPLQKDFKDCLKGIKPPRQPKKLKHSLAVLMIYGILMFIYQQSSLRNANKEMSTAIFFENMKTMFPDFETLPHADT